MGLTLGINMVYYILHLYNYIYNRSVNRTWQTRKHLIYYKLTSCKTCLNEYTHFYKTEHKRNQQVELRSAVFCFYQKAEFCWLKLNRYFYYLCQSNIRMSTRRNHSKKKMMISTLSKQRVEMWRGVTPIRRYVSTCHKQVAFKLYTYPAITSWSHRTCIYTTFLFLSLSICCPVYIGGRVSKKVGTCR